MTSALCHIFYFSFSIFSLTCTTSCLFSEHRTCYMTLLDHLCPRWTGLLILVPEDLGLYLALLYPSFLSLGHSCRISGPQLPCLVGAEDSWWSMCPLELWGLNVRTDVKVLYELQSLMLTLFLGLSRPLWWEFIFQEKKERKENRRHHRASLTEEQGLGKVTWDPAQLQENTISHHPQEEASVFTLLQELVIITTSPLSASAHTGPAITD